MPEVRLLRYGLYLAALLMVMAILLFESRAMTIDTTALVQSVGKQSGVPNTVAGIILDLRLYDTVFEVVVFTLAALGVKIMLSGDIPRPRILGFRDPPSAVLARLGSTICALVAIELALRGHLTPGGGFAAGVAGGTAIGLVVITGAMRWSERVYERYRAEQLEKQAVLAFLLLAALSLMGLALPLGGFGDLLSGGWIVPLNILVALKVTLGSWTMLVTFVRYRGLLE